MNRTELKLARILASLKGGDVRCIDPQGVVKWELGIRAQILKGRDLVSMTDVGDTIELVGGVSAMLASGERVKATPYGAGATDSGANPDFVPTNYTAAEVRLRNLLKDVQKKSDALEKRQKSFAAAADKVKADKAEQAEKDAAVIEDEKPAQEPVDTPAEDPKTAPAS